MTSLFLLLCIYRLIDSTSSAETGFVTFLQENSGRIESPGYPYNYMNSASKRWIIEAPMGFHIQITFDVFILEEGLFLNCPDYVQIIDPERTDLVNNKKRYCGTSLATSTITSRGRRMEILFHSDFLFVRQGFSASWVTVCGYEFKGSSGEIIGPNNASGYPENQNCTWSIRVQNGYRLLLTLNVASCNDWNNSSLDYIQLKEWQNETALVKGNFYSGSFTFEFYNSLEILFQSDNDSSTGLSFNASWMSECRKIFRANTGELRSPDYPVGYDDEIRCIWTIEVSSGHVVLLNYTLLKTSEDKDPCNPHVLQVTEAAFSALKIMCKNNDFNIYRSSSNTLCILFTHEQGTKYTKFFAMWHAEEASRKTYETKMAEQSFIIQHKYLVGGGVGAGIVLVTVTCLFISKSCCRRILESQGEAARDVANDNIDIHYCSTICNQDRGASESITPARSVPMSERRTIVTDMTEIYDYAEFDNITNVYSESTNQSETDYITPY